MVLTDIKGLGEITTISKGCVSAVVDSLGAKVLALFVNDENTTHSKIQYPSLYNHLLFTGRSGLMIDYNLVIKSALQ